MRPDRALVGELTTGLLIVFLSGCPQTRNAPGFGGTSAPDGGSISTSDSGAPLDGGDAGRSEDAGLPDAGDGGTGGLTILSFGTNVTELVPGESVTFVAVCTDVAGLQALAGGVLESPDGTIQYGAFVASSQGSYSLTLSWSQINQAEPITFDSNDQRSFEAAFFDSAGSSAHRTTSITLTCNGMAACDGVCIDIMTDDGNCGSCGTACGSPTTTCTAGVCACPTSGEIACGGACVNTQMDTSNCGGRNRMSGRWFMCAWAVRLPKWANRFRRAVRVPHRASCLRQHLRPGEFE